MSGKVSFIGCTHTPDLTPPPVRGDTVYCIKCRVYRTVARALTAYRVVCLCCPLSRNFDRGLKLEPYHFIDRHRAKYPEHSMVLMDGNRIDSIYQPDESARIPIDGNAPF